MVNMVYRSNKSTATLEQPAETRTHDSHTNGPPNSFHGFLCPPRTRAGLKGVTLVQPRITHYGSVQNRGLRLRLLPYCSTGSILAYISDGSAFKTTCLVGEMMKIRGPFISSTLVSRLD